jgi:hypothetical protein
VDILVAWNGCSAIANLAVENQANRVRLGAAGACEVVVDALRRWGRTNMDVAFYGRRAICCLGKDEVNKLKLKNLGALFAELASMESELSEASEEEL